MNKKEEKELISVIRFKYDFSGSCYIHDSDVIDLVKKIIEENGVHSCYLWECEKRSVSYGSVRYWAIVKLEQMEKDFAEGNRF